MTKFNGKEPNALTLSDEYFTNLSILSFFILNQKNYHHGGLIYRFLEKIMTEFGSAVISSVYCDNTANFIIDKYESNAYIFQVQCEVENLGATWNPFFSANYSPNFSTTLSTENREVLSFYNPFCAKFKKSRSRLRKLDTISESIQKLELLYISESLERSFCILEGGMSALTKHKPYILFNFDKLIDCTKLSRYLEKLGYCLLNSLLIPVDKYVGPLGIDSYDNFFISIPKDFLHRKGLVQALWPKSVYLNSTFCWEHSFRSCLIKEALSGGIFFSNCPPNNFHYDFDDKLSCEGFYPAESNDTCSWRWLGPENTATIWLPCPEPGIYIVELMALSSTCKDIDDFLNVYYNDELLQIDVENSCDYIKITSTFEVAADDPKTITIKVTTPTKQVVSESINRFLGICFSCLDMYNIKFGKK